MARKPISAAKCLGSAATSNIVSTTALNNRLYHPRVALTDPVQFVRKGKYNVKIGQSKQFPFASGKPSLTGLRLTFRAVTIAARVERDGRVTAMGTVVDMTAQRGSAAAPDSA
jgi:hypothetical protein